MQTLEKAPLFTLPDEHCRPVSLEEQLGYGPVVLLFYRGDWCAYCNGQLANYVANLETLEALGVRVLAISVDEGPDSAKLKAKLGFPFPVLSDPEHQAINGYAGLEPTLRQGRAIGKPATFILRPDGTIAYRYVGEDYGDRPLIAEVLEKLEEVARA